MDSSIEGNKDQTSDHLLMQEMENIGRCTAQLEDALHEKLSGDPMTTAIFKKIRNYAARVSLLLKARAADVEAGWGTKAALEVQAGGLETSIASPSSVDQSDASVGKRKLEQTGDDRRGGCRRRSQQYAGVRRVESKTLDDGHAWRKYGQKDIQTTKFPRSYFRCTHKYSQGCKAQRQVQKTESDTSTFIITYIGEHSCRDPAAVLAPHIMSPSNSKSSFLINFGENTTDQGDNIQFTGPSLKMEYDDEMSSLTTGNTSSSYHVLQEAEAPAGIKADSALSPADASSEFLAPATVYAPMEFDMIKTDVEFDDLQNIDVCDYFLGS